MINRYLNWLLCMLLVLALGCKNHHHYHQHSSVDSCDELGVDCDLPSDADLPDTLEEEIELDDATLCDPLEDSC